MKKQINRVLYFLFFCALFAGLLTGCADKPPENKIYTSIDAISQLFPGYKTSVYKKYELNKDLFDLLSRGAVIEAYDVQAENSTSYWYPLTLETVVIAVDRSQTDIVISSWNDLLNSETAAVSIPNTPPLSRLISAAVCYGLEGEDFSLNSVVSILEPLNAKRLLKFKDPTSSIQICFDSDAAARIKNGEDIEIIIPPEGTLAYTRGLLSNTQLNLPDNTEQILFESGLRLTDGRCDNEIYPASEQYASAEALTDYIHLNNVMQDWTRTLRRDVRHVYLYRSADTREHILFPAVFLIIAVIWIAFMMRRSQQKEIRHVIFITGILLAGWVLIRIIKYQIFDETVLGRYLWYSFYFFQCCLPLAMLRITSLTGAGANGKLLSKPFYGICSLNLILTALVFTGDLHGLVFKFDLSQPGWSDKYSYSIVYYIFTAVMILELTGGIILMFTRIKHSPRRFGIVFPLIFIGVLVSFIAGYAARVPFFFDTDLTLSTCIFALLFIELCIRSGQIPVNIHYRRLFRSTSLNLQITDSNGKSILTSKDAEPINPEMWELLKNSGGPVYKDANTIMMKNKISGGYAVWQEDITSINKLREELETSNKNLAVLNNTLSKILRTKEQAAGIKARTELYTALERDISCHEQRLAEMLRKKPDDSSEHGANIGIIAVLVCYIKRKCQLLLLEMSGNEFVDLKDIVVYLDELTEIALLTGIECLATCGLNGALNIHHTTLFYDFFNSLLEWSAANDIKKIILRIVSENDRVMMKILMSVEALDFSSPEQIIKEISAAGGRIEKEDLEDMAGIILSFPKGGVRDA